MPVRIVHGPTHFDQEEVNRQDFLGGIQDYLQNVSLQTDPQRGTDVLKTFSCFFPKYQLEALLAQAEAGGGLRIHFSVALDGQVSCDTQVPYANKLSVTVLATDAEGNDRNEVGDLALMPGFKNINKGDKDCCGGLVPPPPY